MKRDEARVEGRTQQAGPLRFLFEIQPLVLDSDWSESADPFPLTGARTNALPFHLEGRNVFIEPCKQSEVKLERKDDKLRFIFLISIWTE